MFFFCLFFLNGEPRDADLIVLLLLWSTMIIKSSWILNHSRFAQAITHSGFRRLYLLSDSNACCPYMQQIPLIVLNARSYSKAPGGHVACFFSRDAYRVVFFFFYTFLHFVFSCHLVQFMNQSYIFRFKTKKSFLVHYLDPWLPKIVHQLKREKKSCRQPEFEDSHHVKSQLSLHRSDYFIPGLSGSIRHLCYSRFQNYFFIFLIR